jgi:hypothetical protein
MENYENKKSLKTGNQKKTYAIFQKILYEDPLFSRNIKRRTLRPPQNTLI